MKIIEFEQVHKMTSILDGLNETISELECLLQANSERSMEEEERLEWLRSQIIGRNVEFETPFGKRILTYADHTATGQCLQYIEDYIMQQVLPFYGNTHTNDSFVGKKTTDLACEAADYIRMCMGAGPEDVLIFCGSGATASIKRLQEMMGIAVPSIMRDRLLSCLRDEERWVVFVGPYEHHSNLLSWRQSLAEVVEIGIDDEGLIDMEALRVELESSKYANRPMLGSFSACSNVTGIITDTRDMARLLHQHGAFACFDFASSSPYVEIDMKSGEIDGYDAVFLSPHKFIGGPGTPGILLVNKALYHLRSSPPSTCGGGTVAYVNGFNEKDTLYHDDIEEREDAGTPPIIQKIRAALAFWVKEYIGYNLINLHESIYVEMALNRLLPNSNICVLGNQHVERLPILSFLVFPSENSRSDMDCELITNNGKPLNGRFVAKLLNDLFGIQGRGGCACAGPYGHHLIGIDKALSLRIRSHIEKGYNGLKPGWTRVSFPYYMPKEEFAFILHSIEFIAAYGNRFLPLYQFDWVTGDWSIRKRTFRDHLMREEITFSSSGSSSENTSSMNLRQRGGIASDKDSKTIKASKRFASYLESAHRTALSLPDQHPQRSVPEDIDQSLIMFRI